MPCTVSFPSVPTSQSQIYRVNIASIMMDSTNAVNSVVKKITVITGSNRGIGLAIVTRLAQASPDGHFIIASRAKSAGEEAIMKLRGMGITASLEALPLDINDDSSVQAATKYLTEVYGKLDVLVNNAAIARTLQIDAKKHEYPTEYRRNYSDIYSTNVVSTGLLIELLRPLLRCAAHPKVINVSSARGSLGRSSAKELPPTVSAAYSISKTALNAMTVEMQKTEDQQQGNIQFFLACPGHCKTAFNGYRGLKDPLDGARVVEQLVSAPDGEFEFGFYEYEEDGMRKVAW